MTMFDPLNAALTQWGDIPPDDQEAFRAIAREGWMVQFFANIRDRWEDVGITHADDGSIQFFNTLQYYGGAVYRFHPYAMALREISQLGGNGPAIQKARRITRMAMK